MYGAKRAGRDRVSIERHAAPPAPAPASVTVPPSGRDEGRAGAGGIVRPRRAIATSTTQTGATRWRVPARRLPRVEGIARPHDPRPSMFTERFPSLKAGSQPRSTARTRDAASVTTRPPGASSTPSGASADAIVATSPAAASAVTSSRAPTSRARRFRVDHPHDRTFERTMRHFLDGDEAGGQECRTQRPGRARA
jgi:hypothetical protein